MPHINEILNRNRRAGIFAREIEKQAARMGKTGFEIVIEPEKFTDESWALLAKSLHMTPPSPTTRAQVEKYFREFEASRLRAIETSKDPNLFARFK